MEALNKIKLTFYSISKPEYMNINSGLDIGFICVFQSGFQGGFLLTSGDSPFSNGVKILISPSKPSKTSGHLILKRKHIFLKLIH